MSLPTIQIGDTSYNPLRIFCIGVNYDAHQMEMGKSYADRCVIFMKPITTPRSTTTIVVEFKES